MAETKPGRDMEMMACREITEAHLEEKETIACQEEMEADAKKMEPDSEMMQSVVEHQDIPVQDATVMPVREPEGETTSITRKETMACQEMEERLEDEEPTSVDRKSEVAQQ
jgi:hypothetical protein